MRRQPFIEETTLFPAFDTKAGKKVWLEWDYDLVIEVIDLATMTPQDITDEPHEGRTCSTVMVRVNQPSRQLVDAEMVLVAVDVDQSAELTLSNTANYKTGQPIEDLLLLNNSQYVDLYSATITTQEVKAELVDIEISALELSTGNFEADTFVSDCEHIATLARYLRDHLTNDTSSVYATGMDPLDKRGTE